MTNANPNIHPESNTSFRVLPGLVLEIYGPDTSVKVRLSPRGALGVAQALIFDARQALFDGEGKPIFNSEAKTL